MICGSHTIHFDDFFKKNSSKKKSEFSCYGWLVIIEKHNVFLQIVGLHAFTYYPVDNKFPTK